MRWYQRFFRRGLTEKHFDADLRFHLEQQIGDYIGAGTKPEEARRGAQLEFGGLDQVRKTCRDVGTARVFETLAQDARYSLRQLKRNPGFTVVVVITLALGIGANTAVFSVLNGLFLRGLPVPEPHRLLSFSDTNFAWADYLAYRDQAKSFESLSTSCAFPFTSNLNSTRPPQHIFGGLVTGNFLTTLGVKPVLGRGFLPDEDEISTPKPVVMLSYDFWARQFGRDPAIVGKAIRINNGSYAIVGVMPSGLRTVDIGIAPDLWAPMAALTQLDIPEAQWHPFTSDVQGFWIFGRLREGVSRQEALAEVNVIHDRLHPTTSKQDRRPVALSTDGVLPGEFGTIFLGVSAAVMAVAGLVLLLVCLNIANLLLARGTSRRREIAVRLAMGADRRRVIRELMTGNLILSFLGATAGVLLAWVAARAVTRVNLPLDEPIVLNFAPDLRVLLVTTGIAILTCMLFGLAPAVRATRMDVNASLKEGDATSTSHSNKWTRNALVVVQVAGSVVVLVATALFLHSLWKGLAMDLGFRPENLLIGRVDTTAQGYSGERTALFFQQLEERLSNLPGVRSASVVAPLPLGVYSSGASVVALGTSRAVDANRHLVSARFFETMGIPLIRGRDFRAVSPSSPPVVVVNRALAERLFPDENPLGRQVAWGSEKAGKAYEIIGVVGNSKSKTIGEALTPCLFEFAAQNQKDLAGFSGFGGLSLVIRTAGDPKAAITAVQHEVEGLDPVLPVYGVETMEEQAGKSLVLARLASWFLGVFGFLAVTLAAVGLYGLMSYTIAARTREIAIRMALGASAKRTLSMLARRGLGIVGVGLAIGLAGGSAVGRLVSGLLYGVGSFDPLTFVAVPLALIGVAGLAILLPAHRAAKVDPMVALRHE